MRRHVRIEYTLKPEVDVETYKTEAAAFASAIRAHHDGNAYTVYQHEKDPRRFTHLGSFEPQVVPAMQKEPWFESFTAHLRDSATNGPDVQMVSPLI
jgi:hypothetical protein